MKRQALILLFISSIVILVGAVLTQAAMSPMTGTPASVPAAAEAASSQSIETLCRAMSGEAILRFCLSSNGTGRLISFDGAHRAEYAYAFFEQGDSCPAAPAGFAARNSGETAELLMFGYTQADLTVLGLADRYCMYAAS